jgi:Zn-dependent metalloprotease
VDAGSGAILRDHSLVRRQQSARAPAGGSGDAAPMHAVWTGSAFSAVDRTRPATITTYDLRGNRARTAGLVAGTMPLTSADVAASASAAWADRVVVDAHGHAGAAYDFFLSAFGRRGFDHADAPVAVVVHPGGEADGTGPFDEAAWTGREIVLGDGSAGARPWAAAYDTVVHEFAHAVLDHAAGTPHGPEGRALAEAFADICATAAEFAAQPAGAGPRRADYLIGEDAAAGGLRSLADPRASGHLDHAGPEHARSDAPHAASTIAGHAYYLAVEGGRHEGSGIAVAGVGAARRRDIEQVIYRAWVYLLPAECTFTMARAATRQSARDLFGEGSDAERALEQAWTAVGIR